MKVIIRNIGEVLVKIFYTVGLFTFIYSCIQIHNGAYDYEASKTLFIYTDVLAIYTLLYSVYFLIKYRYSENKKTNALKKSRKYSLYIALGYVINTYLNLDNVTYELIILELFLLVVIICFVALLSHTKQIKKSFSKIILWMGKDEQQQEQDSGKRRRRTS